MSGRESFGERAPAKGAGDARAHYDPVTHRWTPQCPYGDVCTGCDAAGKCSRACNCKFNPAQYGHGEDCPTWADERRCGHKFLLAATCSVCAAALATPDRGSQRG